MVGIYRYEVAIMALKYKLDSLDGLDDATKALYEKKGDKFVLKVEGVEDGDTVGLKNKVENLLTETADLKKKLKDREDAEAAANEAARKALEDAAAKKGDIETLRKSADERVAAARADVEGQYKPKLERYTSTVKRLLVDNVAQALATKIGLKGSERTLIPHITARLDVDEVDGEHRTVVKDAKGKTSTLTIEDLEKEFTSDPAFAPVIAGSKGSGGGAGGNPNKGAGGSDAKTMTRADWKGLPPEKQAAHFKDGGTLVDG